MLQRIRKRMRDQKGFTLIELLVVIIIIAILAAIAIPTFLGQREKAYDAAAKSLVRNAMTAIETTYVDTRDFTANVTLPDDSVVQAASAANLATIEPAINWVDGAIPAEYDSDSIYVWGLDDHTYSCGTISQSGEEFSVVVTKTGANAGTVYTPSPW